MIIEIKEITAENPEALKLPNEPFLNEGRLIPIYDGENWSYRMKEFPAEQVTERCFPDENYKDFPVHTPFLPDHPQMYALQNP